MLDFKPQIVHFTGHGEGKDGLAFEDTAGQLKLVDSEALANLFKLFSNRVECVVLNACYSDFQAEAISQYIDYVIGMSQAIGDRAAIEFSVGFYAALGAGESIEFAYKLGCNAIQLEGIPEHLTPVLFKKKDESVRVNSQNLYEEASSVQQADEILPTIAEPLTAEEFCRRGDEKCNLKDHQGAIADYSEAIRLKSDDLSAYFFRAAAKFHSGNWEGTVTDCTKVIQLQDDFHDAHCLRGTAKDKLGDYRGAIADYTEAICLQPNALYYMGRGWAKLHLKDFQSAIVDFNQAIRLGLDDLDFKAYEGRGYTKFRLGDKQGAIADFNDVIRLQPDYATAYWLRGGMKTHLGDKQGAIVDCREAMKLYEKQGDTEGCFAVLEKIKEIEKGNQGFWGWLFS
jgi:tetratricopeptide (TPR) repeat protein